MFLLVFDKYFKTTTTVIIVFSIILALLVVLYLKKRFLLKEEKKNNLKVFLNTILNLILVIGAFGSILYLLGFDYESVLSPTKLLTLVNDQIGRILVSAVTVIISIGIYNLVKSTMKKMVNRGGQNKKRRQTINKVTVSFTRYGIYIIDIALLLGIWGIDVTPILAGLGIAGLVIGLGAQRLITDFISGLFIVFEHHFDVGDIVQVNGFKGTVVDIGLKTTRIRNWRNEVLIVANGNISEVTNYSLNNSVAYVEFSISYRNNLSKAISLLEEFLPVELKDNQSVLEPPVVRGVTNLGEKGATIGVMIVTKTEEHYGVQRIALLKIKEIMDKNNIFMELPQVFIKKDSNENHGI